MDTTTTTTVAWIALLGALLGAGAAIAGQLLTAWMNMRADRLRIAVDAGYEEWKQHNAHAQLEAQAGRPA